MSDILSETEINALLPTECQCNICKSMCIDSRPCWGTPDEMQILIDKGFGKKLMCDYYDGDCNGVEVGYTEIIAPALVGREGLYAPSWPIGRCALLTTDGMCSIHNIKPVEGRVCDHHHDKSTKYLHTSLVHLWGTEKGKEVVKRWYELNDEKV